MIDELGTGYSPTLDIGAASELVERVLTAVRAVEGVARPFLFEYTFRLSCHGRQYNTLPVSLVWPRESEANSVSVLGRGAVEFPLKVGPGRAAPHQEDEVVEVSFKFRRPVVVCHMLVVHARTMSRFEAGVFLLKLGHDARCKARVNDIVRPVADIARLVLRSRGVRHILETEELLIEIVGEYLGPLSPFIRDVLVENCLERLLVSYLLVARRLIHECDDTDSRQPAYQDFTLFCDVLLAAVEPSFFTRLQDRVAYVGQKRRFIPVRDSPIREFELDGLLRSPQHLLGYVGL